ncbi:membrane-associated protein [Mucilaginibacter frigoritolerans]|jgi:membrane-associated protein|uniref:Membrane-associated protein n=1 Tax=Mucilaginibacter frigoritolerans TaxID=652788 RepID=A0A562U260_9SPHI|nr:VTT domain-containing protein [Mucilaginibacter frigoritolerans]TWI99925.1 membrane-associated protein [Mucilaginibacter frigoritolerans]
MDNFWEHLQNLTDAQSIISLGFYFLLIVVFAETGLFFGFFLPGDYLLFMSGLLCSTGRFDISIYTLVLSLIGAGILGNFTGYWFGYRAGPSLFSKNNSFFFKRHYVELAEEFYAKHGGMALVLGRFFPIIRTFAPIFAGIVKLDLKKFTIYNIIGSVAWVNTFTLAGYFLGRRYPQLKDYMEYIVIGLIIITTIPLIFAFLKRKLQRRQNVNELK